ncbi:hypothetical protein MASR1M12_03080 [Erysipelotrichia bacterium]
MDYLTLRTHVSWLAKAIEDRPVIIRGIDLPGRVFRYASNVEKASLNWILS